VGVERVRAGKSREDGRSGNAEAASPPAAAQTTATGEALRRLAHELRAPIAAIISGADVIENESLGPLGQEGYRDYAVQIRGCAQHALAVVEEAMAGLTAIQHPEPAVDLEDIDLPGLVAACLEMVAPLAADAGVSLSLDDAPSCRIASDPMALRQIVINLLDNAIKFTPQTGVVRLTVEEVEGQVVLRIVDTGLGMGPVELARLRAGHARQGIGYSVIRTLTERCNAVLSVTSIRGEGTTVTLSFPASESVLHDHGEPEPSS
jgi:signal transduction histidine kinase